LKYMGGNMDATGRIILALDGLDKSSACDLIEEVVEVGMIGYIRAFKIHDLWDGEGPEIVRALKRISLRVRVFDDLKMHDIRRTVEKRAVAVKAAGADMLSVHTTGGVPMLEGALAKGPEDIVGITVPTSLSPAEVLEIYNQPLEEILPKLARYALKAKLPSLVCSPTDLMILKAALGDDFRKLQYYTPGVRSPGAKVQDDQKRVDTPAAAFQNGATAVVVASEVLEAADRIAALRNMVRQIEAV
jgi:orotidine-5'-phosphate decarboxylase